MKHTLFLILAIAIFTVACTKKSTHVNCYACAANDSLFSNIPVLVNPHYDPSHIPMSGLDCQLTEAQKNFYVLENTKVDTLYFKNDTLEVEHWTMDCTVAY